MGRLIRAAILPGSVLTGAPVLALPIEHGGRPFRVLLDLTGPRRGRVRVVRSSQAHPLRSTPVAEGSWRHETLDIQHDRGRETPEAERALLTAAEEVLLVWGLYTRLVAEVAAPPSDPSQRPTRPDLSPPVGR